MSLHAKVILLGLLTAALLVTGIGLQKLNGVRGGNPFFSPLILLAGICLAPTFFIPNVVYRMGGPVALFVAVAALHFVGVALLGRLAFGEPLTLRMIAGFVLILLGVSLVALGGGPGAR